MTPEQKKQITQLLKLKMEEQALSQNKAAVQADVAAATLSSIVTGKWENISEEMWQKISVYVGYDPNEWLIVGTENLDRIFNICRDAQQHHRTLAIIGATGLGKTTATDAFQRKNKHVYRVVCRVAMSRKDLLSAIARQLSLDIEGSVGSKLEAIITTMLSTEKALLILDSVHKLGDSCIEIVQQLTEALEYNAGIVLAGTPALRKYIDKNAGKDKRCFKELKRRIGYWEPLKPISEEVIRRVAERYGITDRKSLEFIQRNAPDMGTLREIINGYVRAAAKSDKSPVQLLLGLHLGTRELEAA